jgi:hypothetical protein
MNLSRLDRKVLQFIKQTYPVPWSPAEADAIIALGERPLATLDDIHSHLVLDTVSWPDLEGILARLISYQCVAKVYLASRDDYRDAMLAPGRIVRMSVTRASDGSSGKYGYQITHFGNEYLDGLPLAKLKALAWRSLEKSVEKVAPPIIWFLLGLLASSLFGLDIRKLIGPLK